MAAAAAARSSEAETGRLSQAEAELSQLRTSVRTMVRTHVARMLSTCPVSQRHLPPLFIGHFSPVLRRLFAVLLLFPASWRQDGENGRKMA